MFTDIQWVGFLLMAGVGLGLPLWRIRSRSPGVFAGGVVVLVCTVGWAWRQDRIQSRRRDLQVAFERSVPAVGRPGGYQSSDSCQSCHPAEFDSWHASYHRTMTQFAVPGAVQADFSKGPLQLDGQSYRFERRDEEYWVEMPDQKWLESPANRRALLSGSASPPRVTARLGLITGSHHMQVFWISGEAGNLQRIFPFSWLIQDQRWVPVHETFLRDPKLGGYTHLWNANCIHCHATGGQPRPNSGTGTVATRVGELGIACEACHGPGESHIRANQNPLNRYLGQLANRPLQPLVNPAKLSKDRSAQVCGQCHGIKWIPTAEKEHLQQHGFTYRPGDDLEKSSPIAHPARLDLQEWLREPLRQNPRFLEEHFWADGEVRVTGREFNGLLDSPCYERGSLTCLSCHASHQSDPDGQLAAGRRGNDACLQCHSKLRDQIEQHTHHPAASSGSQCYNCHMPHTTYGLLKAIRSHRISSPRVATTLASGRPNACNLCHLDKTLAWTGKHLVDWYQQPPVELPVEHTQIAASVVWTLKGDAGQRALIAWHYGWEPATAVSGMDWLPLYIGHMLDDPYSAVRYIAARSLRRIPAFAEFQYDFVAPPELRAAARAQVIRNWAESLKGRSASRGSEVLLDPQSSLDARRFLELSRQRDNRSMDLQE